MKRKIIFVFVLAVVLIIAACVAVFIFSKNKNEAEPNPSISDYKKDEKKNLSWEEIIPGQPVWERRDAHSTVVFKDKIWLFGGVTGPDTKNPVYEKMPHQSDLWSSDNG